MTQPATAGVTLVELLIATSLFGVMSLLLASLFTFSATQQISTSNSADLSLQLDEIGTAIDAYVANATRIVSCSCQNLDGTTGCLASASSAHCNVANNYCSNDSSIDLEYEDAVDPSVAAYTGCYLPDARAATVVPENLTPRGCKKIVRIAYGAPTPASTSTPPYTVGSPGKITITDVTDSASPRTLNTMTGVYYFRCGQVAANKDTSNDTPSSDAFGFEIRAKARATNLNFASAVEDLEGWYPKTPGQASDPGFQKGIHRTIELATSFRNLAASGIQFGKLVTRTGCIDVSESANSGVTARDRCCSGYYRSSLQKCIASSACRPAGKPADDADHCCSHMYNGSVCL